MMLVLPKPPVVMRTSAHEKAAFVATSPTFVLVKGSVVTKYVAFSCVLRPNCILGPARAAPAPIKAAVKEALEPGRRENVEMVPLKVLRDNIKKEMLVLAAVWLRPLLATSCTSAAPFLSDRKQRH